MRATLIGLLCLCQVGCSRATILSDDPQSTDVLRCGPRPDSFCMVREDGPCSRFVQTSWQCHEDSWRCPAGAVGPYTPGSVESSCRPYDAVDGPLTMLASAGIALPRPDGRCGWIMSEGSTHHGGVAHPAAILPDHPIDGCPTTGLIGDSEPLSVIHPETLGEEAIVSLGDSFLLDGIARVIYRHWVWDDGEPFGVRLIGTRIGDYLPSDELSLAGQLLWTPETSFGDAALRVDGRTHVFGCYGPAETLTYGCRLARSKGTAATDAGDYEYFAGGDDWSDNVDDAQSIFESGPHRAAVRFHPGRGLYVHIFVIGFGNTLQMRTAAAPQGPWSSPTTLGGCELPDDADAFCAAPALRLELMTDLRPDELVITYDIGTSEPQRREQNPRAYWPRLIRLAMP